MEDDISTDGVGDGGAFQAGMQALGERQMKLHLLAPRSLPAAWPGS